MTSETPDMNALVARLDAIIDRLEKVEVQVRGLETSQTVEGMEFVVKDERGQPRARFELAGHSPQVVFYDRLGKERLRIGLRTDGSPSIQIGGREVPLPVV